MKRERVRVEITGGIAGGVAVGIVVAVLVLALLHGWLATHFTASDINRACAAHQGAAQVTDLHAFHGAGLVVCRDGHAARLP